MTHVNSQGPGHNLSYKRSLCALYTTNEWEKGFFTKDKKGQHNDNASVSHHNATSLFFQSVRDPLFR
jgi:hypothetical protein